MSHSVSQLSHNGMKHHWKVSSCYLGWRDEIFQTVNSLAQMLGMIFQTGTWASIMYVELENTELLKIIVVSWRYYLLVIVGWARAELLQSYKTKTEDPKYLAVCSWVRVSRSITGSLGCVPTSNLQYSPRQKTMFWGWALNKRQKEKGNFRRKVKKNETNTTPVGRRWGEVLPHCWSDHTW